MYLGNFSLSWVDFAVMLIVFVGVLRGRKRGMSEELLDLVKWIAILVVASIGYGPVGDFLAYKLPFSALSCYLTAYIGIILIFHVGFVLLRRQIGDKLVGSDFFGRAEYYLGMVAGGLRFTCVTVVVLALLNARHYSAEEIRADDAYQERYYGTIRFPTMYALQKEIFQTAWTGKLSREHAPFLLIRQTAPEEKGLGPSGIARARERDFNDVLNRR